MNVFECVFFLTLSISHKKYLVCQFFIKKKTFHTYEEILCFLFYHQLKSVDFPNLFSYPFDTSFHMYAILSFLKEIKLYQKK